MQGKKYINVVPTAALLTLLMASVPAPAIAQQGTPLAKLMMPAGQSLSVGLQHGLKAGKTSVGAPVEAYTTQRVPTGPASYLPSGATLTGTVTESVRGTGSQPSKLGLRLSALHWHGQTIPVEVNVVALANKAWVDGANKPVLGASDRGSSGAANWTTEQIGGDALMRSGWSGELVDARGHKVGFADFNGIYAFPAGPGGASPSSKGAVATPEAGVLTVPRALGPFSAAARGPYGYGDDAALQQVPGSSCVLSAPGKLEIRHGDALLLTVISAGSAVR